MTDLCLWAGTLRGVPVRDRIDIAASCGFAEVSLAPTEFHDDLGGYARSRGVRLACLDPVVAWLPGSRSAHPAHQPYVRYGVDEIVDMARCLGVRSLNAIDVFWRAPRDAAAAFADLCDRAAGLTVHLEFQVYSAIPDLATAWRIVAAAGRPNGLLLVDSWHHARAHPAMELPDLPVGSVAAVQLSDGLGRPRGTLVEDSTQHRMIPGEGAFNLTGLLNDLAPHRPSVGAEVFSRALAALPPREAARRVHAGLLTTLAASENVTGTSAPPAARTPGSARSTTPGSAVHTSRPVRH
jgi:sugar phosphate isomerase/epimerase